jgi:hypothetical protein
VKFPSKEEILMVQQSAVD